MLPSYVKYNIYEVVIYEYSSVVWAQALSTAWQVHMHYKCASTSIFFACVCGSLWSGSVWGVVCRLLVCSMLALCLLPLASGL